MRPDRWSPFNYRWIENSVGADCELPATTPNPLWNPSFPFSLPADGFPGSSTNPIVLLNTHPLAVTNAIPTSLDNLTDAEYNAVIQRLRQAIRYAP